jgi:ankyrin repeat protein
MLLSAGASANQRARERHITPLALAAQFKRAAIVKELLRRGAEVNAEWRSLGGPSNALDYAALSGDVATMRLLVDAGAPIEAQGKDSQGPLVHAAWSGRAAPVQYLLALGADPKRRIVEPLLPATHSALRGAVGSGSAEVVRLLLKAGVDPNLDADDLGNTPLHRASWWKSNYDVVKALVDAGAKVDAVDRLKRTPLNSVLSTWQWQSDQTGIVRLLLSKGADPNRLNNHGVSPLMLAAVKCPPTSELIQTLLDAGADKNARDPQGKSALDRFMAMKDCPADSRASDERLQAIEKLLTPR